MDQPPPQAAPIRNISDTALWAALYRARENERPDALFRDPLAAALAGERGKQIAATMPFSDRNTWSWIARTVLFDQFISQEVAAGAADLVVNLAAGLDARPYRMKLPATLRWIEVDLPDILAYKQQIIGDQKSGGECTLERIAMDLSDRDARRALFARLGSESRKALLISEGFLIYLPRQRVGELAEDLGAVASFNRWIIDLASPGLLKLLQKKIGGPLAAADSPLQFGPEEGPHFFEPHGWRPIEVQSLLKTAAKLKRLSLVMRLLAMLPASNGRQGSRPWGGVCLLGK
jgi:methyltransferase (TIGR00027 family)